jgi:hypothetical protein
MKTDASFYELFKIYPKNLFALLSLNMEGDYVFESITAKTILQRFPKLTLKDVQQMLQLTPLEKSVAVQQLIRINVTKSKKEANSPDFDHAKGIIQQMCPELALEANGLDRVANFIAEFSLGGIARLKTGIK